MNKSEITVRTQGIKAGKANFERKGSANLYATDRGQTMSDLVIYLDSFIGAGITYKNREKTLINIEFENQMIFTGGIEDLVAQLKLKEPVKVAEVVEVKKPINMSKKYFKEHSSVHQYGKRGSENGINAIFFDWKSSPAKENYFAGFKYCLFTRASNATQKVLADKLYDLVTGKIEDVEEYYIQVIIAQNDQQRFKVPISSGGLNSMCKR